MVKPNYPIKQDPGKEVIVEETVNSLYRRKSLLYKGRNSFGIKRSNKTLWKHKIDIVELNQELGFNRIDLYSKIKLVLYLKKKFNDVEIEKTFDGMVGKTGCPLRIDFYIPELNLAVEADGCQHNDPNHPWFNFKTVLY